MWFRRGGHLKVAANPAQEGAWLPEAEACARLGEAEQYENLSAEEVAARCSSPRLGGGAFNPGGATVQPARLALGLRDALLEAGVVVHEHSRARRVAARAAASSSRPTPGAFALRTRWSRSTPRRRASGRCAARWRSRRRTC